MIIERGESMNLESMVTELGTVRHLRLKAYREVTDVSDAVLLARFQFISLSQHCSAIFVH